MVDDDGVVFSAMIHKIMQKSLFTERQIKIILNQRGLLQTTFNVSRGAYYRQQSQVREKLIRFYYTVVLLRGLGILSSRDLNVISKVVEQLSVIKTREMTREEERNITDMVEKVLRGLERA